MGEFAIGQGVSRFEDPRLVRGAGHYTDDVQLPGMAYGVVLRSGHAHAKINSIDTVAAKASPGVLAVITAADWKAAGLGELPSHAGLKRPGGGADVQAALHCTGARPRALGRRPRRLRRRRNPGAGARCRGKDRRRLRGTAGGCFNGGRHQARQRPRLRRLPGQYLVHGADRRQGRVRCGLCQG